MIPPNETDILISSYLKMNPRVLNFCPIQKIKVSNSKTENNFISLMVDDSFQNPKQEIKKWKEAYKKVTIIYVLVKYILTRRKLKYSIII